jgi:hypothetical protein
MGNEKTRAAHFLGSPSALETLGVYIDAKQQYAKQNKNKFSHP